MDPTLISLLCILALFVFMMMGIPIAYSLGFVAVTTALMTYGPNALYKVGTAPFTALFNLGWTPLPLFGQVATLPRDAHRATDNP